MKGPTDMRRSIATVSLIGTLPEKIDTIAAAGFDAIERFEPDFTHFAGAARDLRALCDERGLAIELFQPFRDFKGMPEAQHRRNLDCNRSPCAAATSSLRSARCAKVGCASCRSPATTTTICRAASKSTPPSWNACARLASSSTAMRTVTACVHRTLRGTLSLRGRAARGRLRRLRHAQCTGPHGRAGATANTRSTLNEGGRPRRATRRARHLGADPQRTSCGVAEQDSAYSPRSVPAAAPIDSSEASDRSPADRACSGSAS